MNENVISGAAILNAPVNGSAKEENKAAQY